MINTFYCCCYCCCSVKQRVMITLTVMVDVLDVNPPAGGREWNMERCLTGLSPPNMPPPPRPNMPPGGGGCLHYAEYTLSLRNLMHWYAVLEICNGRDQLISCQSHFYAKPFHPPSVPIPSIWNILAYSSLCFYMYTYTFWYRCYLYFFFSYVGSREKERNSPATFVLILHRSSRERESGDTPNPQYSTSPRTFSPSQEIFQLSLFLWGLWVMILFFPLELFSVI